MSHLSPFRVNVPNLGTELSSGVSNPKKRRKNGQTPTIPPTPNVQDLYAPPISGFGDTIVASNPFDDCPSMNMAMIRNPNPMGMGSNMPMGMNICNRPMGGPPLSSMAPHHNHPGMMMNGPRMNGPPMNGPQMNGPPMGNPMGPHMIPSPNGPMHGPIPGPIQSPINNMGPSPMPGQMQGNGPINGPMISPMGPMNNGGPLGPMNSPMNGPGPMNGMSSPMNGPMNGMGNNMNSPMGGPQCNMNSVLLNFVSPATHMMVDIHNRSGLLRVDHLLPSELTIISNYYFILVTNNTLFNAYNFSLLLHIHVDGYREKRTKKSFIQLIFITQIFIYITDMDFS
ncbi:PREDICTED: protein pygopus-like isoform X2 [Nicrophorus vespilloides]|uniref:Protein pygopus-like isoform X2 n=1 Tax=Nicrophorus vespilloides TaxID=110193 RepID=A0ABM1NAN2_NICVS|nr:PREDICTED: protein pygopus-like isoform X2 [Nicrophorus vespilloides]